MTPIVPIERASARMVLRGLDELDSAEFIRVVGGSRSAWAPWTPAAEPNISAEERFRRELLGTARGLEAGTHLTLAGIAEDGVLVGLFALNEIVRGGFECAYASWQVSAEHHAFQRGVTQDRGRSRVPARRSRCSVPPDRGLVGRSHHARDNH